jgi:hypothetical protein
LRHLFALQAFGEQESILRGCIRRSDTRVSHHTAGRKCESRRERSGYRTRSILSWQT